MAFSLYRDPFSFAVAAASAINPKQPVALAGTNVLFALPIGTSNVRPFGFSGLGSAGASGLNQNDAITIFEEGNFVKAVANASLGVNAEVGVGSTNGSLSPAALVSASGHWAVGIAVSAAAAGETFTLYVKPRKV